MLEIQHGKHDPFNLVLVDMRMPEMDGLEVARQIRLRNLSGIILVDFIDMDTTDEQAQVAAALEEALSSDRTKVVLHGFTSLGLMELTRKRTGPSLREMLTKPCKLCGGTGCLCE